MSRVLCRILGFACLLCSMASFGVAASLCTPLLLADDDVGAPVPVDCTTTNTCPTGTTGICSRTDTGFVCGETGPGKQDCKTCKNKTVNGASTCPCEK